MMPADNVQTAKLEEEENVEVAEGIQEDSKSSAEGCSGNQEVPNTVGEPQVLAPTLFLTDAVYEQVPSGEVEDADQVPGKSSCVDRIAKMMPPWMKTVTSLLVHSFDWCSDIGVSVLLWCEGDRWWATLNGICILNGGFLASLAMDLAADEDKRKLTLKERIVFTMGFGPFAEAYKNPVIIREGKVSWQFVIVRLCEVFGESVPGGALQLYIMIFKSKASLLQVFSLSMSVVSMGYGITAGIRDFSGPIGHFSHNPAIAASIMLGISTDFVWRVVPFAFFMKEPSFRPWSFLAVAPCMVLFECIKGVLCQKWIQGGMISWPEISLNGFGSSLNVLSFTYPVFGTLWNGERDISAAQLFASLAITILVRIPINIAFLVCADVPPVFCWLSGLCGVISTIMGVLLMWKVFHEREDIDTNYKNHNMLEDDDDDVEGENAGIRATTSWTCCY